VTILTRAQFPALHTISPQFIYCITDPVLARYCLPTRELRQRAIDGRDGVGRSLLHTAALSGNVKMLQFAFDLAEELALLLHQHPEARTWVNEFDNRGRTPIFYAVESRCLDSVNLLLDHGALAAPKDPPPALWSSYRHKVFDSCKYDVLSAMESTTTPLGHYPHDPACVGLPITVLADWSPLMRACYHGCLAIVRRLLEAGADPLWPGVLHYAVFSRQKAMVQLVLAAGAQVDTKFYDLTAHDVGKVVNVDDEMTAMVLV
jgi:ankyrin repeat protein